MLFYFLFITLSKSQEDEPSCQKQSPLLSIFSNKKLIINITQLQLLKIKYFAENFPKEPVAPLKILTTYN